MQSYGKDVLAVATPIQSKGDIDKLAHSSYLLDEGDIDQLAHSSYLLDMRFICQRLDDLAAASVRIEMALQARFVAAPGTVGSVATSGAVAEVYDPIHNEPARDGRKTTDPWPVGREYGAANSAMAPLASVDSGEHVCVECAFADERRQRSKETHGSNDTSSSPPGQLQETRSVSLVRPHVSEGSNGISDSAESEDFLVMNQYVFVAADTGKSIDGAVNSVEARRGLGRWADRFASRALDQPIYNTHALYHETGWAQALARNAYFESVTVLVIVLNVLYIGIYNDWDNTPQPADLYTSAWRFILIENAFCVYYCFQLLTRFLAFQEKRAAVRDFWFAFDTFLCLFTVCDTWIWPPLLAITGKESSIQLDFLRILRLAKLARVIHCTRYLPEMITLIEGMFLAYRAVIACLLMVLVLLYAAAIALHNLLDDDLAFNATLKEHAGVQFLTVSDSAWALVHVTLMLDSTGNLLSELRQRNSWNAAISCILLLFFILLTTYTILNMLVGILANVVHTLVLDEQSADHIRLMKNTILVLLRRQDSDSDGYLTKTELNHVINDRSSQETLVALDVNMLFLLEMQSMYFPKPQSQVSIVECMEMMIMCRGNNSATVRTLASGLSWLSGQVDSLGKKVEAMHYEGALKMKADCTSMRLSTQSLFANA